MERPKRIWKEAQRLTNLGLSRLIKWYTEHLELVYHDELVDPKDFKDPGPGHVRLSRYSELRMQLHDCVNDWHEPNEKEFREILDQATKEDGE
jgi:hypothetical protein